MESLFEAWGMTIASLSAKWMVALSLATLLPIALAYWLQALRGKILPRGMALLGLMAQFALLVICLFTALRFGEGGLMAAHLCIGILAAHGILLTASFAGLALRGLLMVFYTGAGAVAIFALGERLSASGIFSHDASRMVGIFSEPNQFGVFMASGAVAGVGFLGATLRMPRALPASLAIGSILAACLTCCVLSGSRGAWVALALGMSRYLFLAARSSLAIPVFRAFVWGMVVACMLASAAWIFRGDSYFVARMISIFDGTDFSVLNRLVAQQAAFDMFVTQPLFGFGFCRFSNVFENFFRPFSLTTGEAITNNEVLSLALAAGGVAAAMMLIALAAGVIGRGPGESSGGWHAVASACVVAMSAGAVLDGNIVFSFIGIVFWLFVNHGLLE